MKALKRFLAFGVEWLERIFDVAFGQKNNPIHHLGALGFLFFWVAFVSGVYLYIGLDTSVAKAFASVEYMTHSVWFFGGVMRSLHRYGSDAIIAMLAVHLVREFAHDRLRGPRWFTWVTGIPLIWLTYIAGISGYWLVWDQLAQYIAVATTEWLDWLPIFGEPIARNFLAPSSLDDRFFTLMIFIHIAVPIMMVFVLWIHLQRVARPEYLPSRVLTLGTMAMLIGLSIAYPATSHAPADLLTVPRTLKLDWWYLAIYPVIEKIGPGPTWYGLIGFSFLLMFLPWLPPLKRPAPAKVDLAYCNGCRRCVNDCPYNAITMVPRSDGRPFLEEAKVDDDLCVSCGICVGACPTSIAFRTTTDLPTGINLPDRSIAKLRQRMQKAMAGVRGGPRILALGCDNGVRGESLAREGVGGVSLPCIAALPPSFIDYALSRNLADGVFIVGCAEGGCTNRYGVEWMRARLEGERDPRLRARVPRERLATCWARGPECGRVAGEIRAFADRLRLLPAPEKKPPLERIPETVP